MKRDRPQLGLQVGQLVPHFEIEALDGVAVAYASFWQRKNLLLVLVPARFAGDFSSAHLRALSALAAPDTACVLSSSAIDGLTGPAVLIADKWGEIHFLARPAHVDQIPSADVLGEWLDHVRHQCPECEGEAR